MRAAQTPLEDLRKQALEHYEEAAKAIVHYSSFVRDAIMAYNPNKTKLKNGINTRCNECEWLGNESELYWVYGIGHIGDESYCPKCKSQNLIEIDLSSANDSKKVLKIADQADVIGSLGFDEGYSKGYGDAQREAAKEIREHYHPNDR